MMRRILFQFVVCVWACGGLVQAGVFDDANRLYEQGKYDQAIPLYENLLSSGYYSAGVLFNLGNAYFKNGELGRAIFEYRRARQIDPRDPDLQANLRFARDRVTGGLSIQPGWADRVLGWLTLNEVAVMTAVLFWAWIALASVVRWRPGWRASLRAYSSLLAFCFFVALGVLGLATRASGQNAAIVVTRQAVVRLGPLKESQESFMAPDGAELRLLARRDDWFQVADRAGRSGWIDSEDVAVFPGTDPKRPGISRRGS